MISGQKLVAAECTVERFIFNANYFTTYSNLEFRVIPENYLLSQKRGGNIWKATHLKNFLVLLMKNLTILLLAHFLEKMYSIR